MDHTAWTARQDERTVRVDGDDRRVAYVDEGDGDPVVFLHGIPTWSFLWRDVAPELTDDHRVVVPDLLGYGNSTQSDDFDRSIRAQETMLDALLDDLDIDTVTLVAHDIGGGVASRFAAHQPERVDRLVLSNAVCYDSWPVEFITDLGLPGAVTGMDDEEFDATFDYAFGDGLHGDDPDPAFVEGMKHPWRSPAGRRSLERCAVATNTNHTTELDYTAITADTLLLWGADDVMQPLNYAHRLAEDVAGDTEIVELDDAFHWVVEDRTETYTEAVRDFLD